MTKTLTSSVTDKPSQVDDTMGGVIRASIDDFISNAHHQFTERDIHPEVGFWDIVMSDPEYRQAQSKKDALETEVKKHLPETAHQLLGKYEDAITTEKDFEVQYYYKHGFIDGVAYSKLPERWAAKLGRGKEYTGSSSDCNESKLAPPKRLDDIVKILTGTGHIPSVKQAFYEAMSTLIDTRRDEWYPFSFITDSHYKEAKEDVEQLYEELHAFPEEYRQIASDYANTVNLQQTYAVEDGYFKGMIDGMELQRLMQGTGERGKAQ